MNQTANYTLGPRIAVVGVGGAGGNAVNNMIRANLEGVEFVACNTDAQALSGSLAPKHFQLGIKTTQGLGAGSRPEVGAKAAEETLDEITESIKGSNMVFVTAGMGGGTGTGAAPVVARIARDMGALTIGVVTKPFHLEGTHRMRTAERGIEEMQKHVDTLIVIPNQNLFRLACEKTTFLEALKMADDVLHAGVRGVTDLMVMPGLINLDFNDIRTVMSEMGKAMMGTGEAEGEGRAIAAAEAAISNPLLDDVSMKGARGVLINVTCSTDMTLLEVDDAANRVREEVDPEANIILGATFDEKMKGKMRVSVVATGIEGPHQHRASTAVDHETVGRDTDRWRMGGDVVSAPSFAEESSSTHGEAMASEGESNLRTFPVEQKSDKENDVSRHEETATPVAGVESLRRRIPGLLSRLSRQRRHDRKGWGVDVRAHHASSQDGTTQGDEVEGDEHLDIPNFLRKPSQRAK